MVRKINRDLNVIDYTFYDQPKPTHFGKLQKRKVRTNASNNVQKIHCYYIILNVTLNNQAWQQGVEV